ncbi:MAG TPA: glycosyltransferase family 39 protein [Bryobacteraceae bacterium]|nr:glycosyltransferase family 39 protein [Bryobacteraceae bacterium]
MRPVPPKIPRALWPAVPLAFFLYFFGLGAAGLIGPDEPRYASIGRAMARTGDWITPRLWGQPWFEKPPLLYWMDAIAFRAGLGPELAPRLPVAALAVAFLAFYWWILNREFGCRAACFATLILGTCAGYWGASQLAVPDLPLTATFSAAMLLALPWIGKRETRWLPVAAILLGLAVLAKSLAALALAVPVVWWLRRGRWRDVVNWRVIVPFVVVALPWYVVCYQRNGWGFIDTLFVEHQFGRFTSGALMHVRKWWFYVPVLAGLLAPWTPLVALTFRRAPYRDSRRVFLAAWVVFGLVFFSAAVNKLPGYVLPLLPAAAALIGIALDEAGNARVWLAVCALLLALFPIAAPMIPGAVAGGLSRTPLPAFRWYWLLPVAVAGAAWMMEARGRRLAAVLCVAAGVTGGIVYLKLSAAPQLDRVASAREFWRENAARAGEMCIGDVQREWRYGLNYYSGTALPDCHAEHRGLEIRETGEGISVAAER